MVATAIDETALVTALRHGDEWAFETLVQLHGQRLLAVAERLMGNEDDARDVAQAAYLSAFRALRHFEGSCQISTWLHRIVVNTALMRLRSKRRKPEQAIDGEQLEQFSAWTAPADELLEQEETRVRVRSRINQLPEKYRQVLILRDLEERTTQEVATALSMTPSAVKVRLHRARQALSMLLREDFTHA